MIRNVLNSVAGIGIYPTIALLIFFSIFMGVIIYVLRLKKPYIKLMSELPLEENSSTRGE